MTKFLENLLSDSISIQFYITNIPFHLDSLYDSKKPLVNFELDIRYHDLISLKPVVDCQTERERVIVKCNLGSPEILQHFAFF